MNHSQPIAMSLACHNELVIENIKVRIATKRSKRPPQSRQGKQRCSLQFVLKDLVETLKSIFKLCRVSNMDAS